METPHSSESRNHAFRVGGPRGPSGGGAANIICTRALRSKSLIAPSTSTIDDCMPLEMLMLGIEDIPRRRRRPSRCWWLPGGAWWRWFPSCVLCFVGRFLADLEPFIPTTPLLLAPPRAACPFPSRCPLSVIGAKRPRGGPSGSHFSAYSYASPASGAATVASWQLLGAAAAAVHMPVCVHLGSPAPAAPPPIFVFCFCLLCFCLLCF